MSKFDKVYRKLILSKFFKQGWGEPENMKKIFEFRKKLGNRKECLKLVPSNYPVHIDQETISSNMRIINGHFLSPVVHHLPDLMPEIAHNAYFQMILPLNWKSQLRPMCIHLAGTGDHYFTRRRILMAKPLLEEAGIASILLENPFYGRRKPRGQARSSLAQVLDLFVMGGALMLESLVLLRWCSGEVSDGGAGGQYWPLGLTGVSMGGHMASLAATAWPRPLALAPCLSWSTASCVFTQGVLSSAVDWRTLREQLHGTDLAYRGHILDMLHPTPPPLNDKSLECDCHISQPYPSASIDGVETSTQQHDRSHHHCEESDVDGGGVARVTAAGVPMPVGVFEPSGSGDAEWTVRVMRGVLDAFTHLANFSPPADDSLVVAVAAEHDAYVPRQHVTALTHVWPGAHVRYLNMGHVHAYLFHQHSFRTAIKDAFNKTIEKYGNQSQRMSYGRYQC